MFLIAGASASVAQEPQGFPAPDGEGEARFGTTVVIPSGLRGQIYYLRSGTMELPKFEKLEPVGTIYTSALNITPRSFTDGFPGVTKRFEWFAIDYNGKFYINEPGKYRFMLVSDDGSKLYIDGKKAIDNDGVHGPLAVEGKVILEGGIHGIRVSYFQGPRETVALMLGVAGPRDKEMRLFSTNEFKPPANPADWKYGKPEDAAPDPDAGRVKLKDVIKK